MSKYELASWYGYQMQRYGMSYYNERMNVSDPTPTLYGKPEFKALDSKDKETIVEYGNNMKRFGMGMYAERGACAEYYDKCGGCPPTNPFAGQMSNDGAEPGRE